MVDQPRIKLLPKLGHPMRTLVQWTAIAVISEVVACAFVPPAAAMMPLALAITSFALGWLGDRRAMRTEIVVLLLGCVTTLGGLVWFGVLSAVLLATPCYMWAFCGLLGGGSFRAYRKRRKAYGRSV
jgi:MFS family permease